MQWRGQVLQMPRKTSQKARLFRDKYCVISLKCRGTILISIKPRNASKGTCQIVKYVFIWLIQSLMVRFMPRSKRSTSPFIFPRDRPLADLSAALSIRNWPFRLISIPLSRFFLSGSSSGSPGGAPSGCAATLLTPAEGVLLEGA